MYFKMITIVAFFAFSLLVVTPAAGVSPNLRILQDKDDPSNHNKQRQLSSIFNTQDTFQCATSYCTEQPGRACYVLEDRFYIEGRDGYTDDVWQWFNECVVDHYGCVEVVSGGFNYASNPGISIDNKGRLKFSGSGVSGSIRYQCPSSDHTDNALALALEIRSEGLFGIQPSGCDNGYERDPQSQSCVDIDECQFEPDPCADIANSSCLNLPGSYKCDCNAGFEGDGTLCCDMTIEYFSIDGSCKPFPSCPTSTTTFTPSSTPTYTPTTLFVQCDPTASLVTTTVRSSCLNHYVEGNLSLDGYYRVDPAGTGPFVVYCDQTRFGGGWALYAYHEHEAIREERAVVSPCQYGVSVASNWRALVESMQNGILLVDENGVESYITRSRLEDPANCITPSSVTSLMINNQPKSGRNGVHVFHSETSGCGSVGLDYSTIRMTDSRAGAGASLVDLGPNRFNVWSYPPTGTDRVSYPYQDELLYFIK